jgi:hypothetical protein
MLLVGLLFEVFGLIMFTFFLLVGFILAANCHTRLIKPTVLPVVFAREEFGG